MQAKIGIRFHRAEITYFEINRLYAYVKQIQQADYLRRNLFLIKVQAQNRLFTKNCITRTEIIHSSCMLFFLSPQYCCFQNSEFNNTLLYQNEGRGNTVTRTSTYLSFKFVVETIRHHYYCMLVKSFIWLTRVWFHRMFWSRVEFF